LAGAPIFIRRFCCNRRFVPGIVAEFHGGTQTSPDGRFIYRLSKSVIVSRGPSASPAAIPRPVAAI
jgi:hypothetical protein